MRPNFTDPYDHLPTLEREIIRLRSYELTLILYYKEDIERLIVDGIECHDRLKTEIDSDFQQRSPFGTKRRFAKALKAMVSDGAISNDEHKLIKKTVDFRNHIGHRVDYLFSDLEQGRFSGRLFDKEMRKICKIPEFDHQAIDNIKNIYKILDRAKKTHYIFGYIRGRGSVLFSSTEKILLSEIKNSRKKIKLLVQERNREIEVVNREIKYASQFLNKLYEERFFDIRHEQGRMTARGEEFCYRLFDEGISDLSVAHIFKMKLRSIQSRKRSWLKLGGMKRPKRDWNTIPAIIKLSRYED